MRVSEPRNAELWYNLARLFARYSGRKTDILDKTMEMLTIALQLQPENSNFHSEMAY